MLSELSVAALRILPMKALLHQIMPPQEVEAFYSQRYNEFKGHSIYIFQVKNNQLQWKINKRLIDFERLAITVNKKLGVDFANFGCEGDVPEDILIKKLERYLVMCINQGNSLASTMLEFLEESGHTYQGLEKYKEISMLKRAGGRFQESCLKCGGLFKSWKIRYFILHNEGIIYKDEFGSVKQYLSYDYDFKMIYGKAETNESLGIVLTSTHRRLKLKALNLFDWVQFIYYVKIGFGSCEYVSINRYGSFAPIRSKCNLKYLIDGEEYFSEVATRLMQAQKEVFITDWWLSPQFHLLRPITEATKQFRLDRILDRIAKRGVKIHIIVYHESTFLLNDSLYTKTYLESMHSNIKVLRHPTTVLPTLWSHHEKLVIIDQKIGFVGGLDLCYGRWDSQQHLLFDIDKSVYPGIEYNNIRVQDIINVRSFELDQYEREKARLPWHDVACMVEGEVVWDLSRHFIQYWNYASFEKQGNDRELLMRNPYKKQGLLKRKLTQGLEKLVDLKNKLKEQFYKNEEEKPVDRMQAYVEKTMNEDMMNEMVATDRSRDLDGRMKTQSPINLQKMAKSLIVEGRNRQKSSVIHDRYSRESIPLDNRFVFLLNQIKQPGEEDQIYEERSVQQQLEKEQATQKIYSEEIEHKQKPIAFRQLETTINGSSQCQIVRSVGPWSIGCSKESTECSVQMAYVELIANSKHYIYIQNQFFISSCADSYIVKNQIGNAIALRIQKAQENNQKFRVYVILPLLPGFAGEVDDPDAKILKLQMHWQYQTISRGENSLLNQLRHFIPNPEAYIRFFGLRTHSRLSSTHQPITEIIYVHSKLMIVDDQYVIVGSANINDRSMRGKRDSEICIVSRDNSREMTLINGVLVQVSRNASNLRKRLFAEHFNLKDQQQLDPLLDYNWSLLEQIALQNTMIYKQVFACYPDDQIKRLADMRDFMRGGNIQKYEELKGHIRGNVVKYPLQFLERENLNLRITQKEYLIPASFAT